MKAALVVFFALLATSALAHGDHDHAHDHDHDEDDHDHPSDVLTLTSETFHSVVDPAELILVEFYAPWCGHCKKLAPEYEVAATQLKGQVPIAKVDCTVHKDVCDENGVQGFPTLKVFRKGSATAYEKGRTSADIVSYMKKQKQPVIVKITSADELATFKTADALAVVAFIDEDHASYAAFKSTAEKLRDDASFGIAPASLNAAHGGKIVLYRTFDEPEVVFSGEASAEGIEKFVKAESFPLFGEIGPTNYGKYVERGTPIAWFFLDSAKENSLADAQAAVKDVAAAHKGAISFVHLDGHKWGSHGKNLGLASTTPGLLLEDRSKPKRFVFPTTDTFKAEELATFFKDFVDGKLQAHVKTQPVPADNNGPVKVIVGSTFDSIVNDPTKNVLVEFYAPWCGHCKTLEPKYNDLGEEYKDHTDVVIAKVDATENDVPAEIEGFPTLIFYPTNNKKGVPYEGERSKEALSAFIKKNSVAPGAKHDDL
jgi:protein disulfide-isomerase A1